jgi:hypothetical protein
VVGLFLAGFVLLDLAVPAMVWHAESPGFAGLLSGAVAGQFGLLTIWAVFGPQRWTLQLPATLGVAALLLAVVILGMIAVDPGGAPRWHDWARLFLFLPLVFLSAQPLLWIARYFGGWRIVRAEEETSVEAVRSRQFGLADLLGATVVLAVALSLANWGFYNERELGETWIPLVVGCLFCAAWNALSTLPCLWASFLARPKGVGVIVILVCMLMMTAAALAILSAMSGRGPPDEAIVGVSMFHGGLAGVMLGVLYAFRRWGYVLRRAGDTRGTTPFGIGGPDAEPVETPPPSEPREPA